MTDYQKYLIKTGIAIKIKRQELNITQEELVSKIYQNNPNSKRSLAQETLSRIENGRFNPSLKLLFLIFQALEVSLADLFTLAQSLEIKDNECS